MSVGAMPRPNAVFVQSEPVGRIVRATETGSGWEAGGAFVRYDEANEASRLLVESPAGPLSRIALRWNMTVAERSRVMGDAWERSYGDLGWSGMAPDRILPWYWLAHDEPAATTVGAGVKAQPAAWCSWTVESSGVTLWVDLRSGFEALHLGSRTLMVAEIIRLESEESPYQAIEELVAALAPAPIVTGPIVGGNNWYHTYGFGFDSQTVLAESQALVARCEEHPVRPYMVIDAGWGVGTGPCDGGPYDHGKDSFQDMAAVADRIRETGARPGLWFRPLLHRHRSELAHDVWTGYGYPLDPSLPSTLDMVKEDIHRFRDWGYEMLKHDFSTFDITGAFAPQFGPALGTGQFTFADRSRTTAEIILDFYRAIADAAEDAVVIGCNTVGHLAAGLVAIQRIGDDTSGRHWERTRRMGVNTLSFRLPQHGRFFAADADCVVATPSTPWEFNRQFLDLVAKSGTPLFLSIDDEAVDAKVEEDLRSAVRTALDGGVVGGVEPLDQLYTTTPERWRVGRDEVHYRWSKDIGAEPFIEGV